MPKLIYGIGYFDTPPFSRTEAYNGFSGKNGIINFYRNGELLWNEECEPETLVVLPKANDEASPYYEPGMKNWDMDLSMLQRLLNA